MLKKIENQTFEVCQEAILQNGFELRYVKDKQTFNNLYDIALNQVTNKYSNLYNIINQMKNSQDKQNEQWLKEFCSETLFDQYFELDTIVYNAFCDNLDEYKQIFDEYNITHYKGNNRYYSSCLSYNEIIDRHYNLFLTLLHGNVTNIFHLYMRNHKKFLENKLNIDEGIEINDKIHDIFCEIKYPSITFTPNNVKVYFDKDAWNNSWNGTQ